MRSIDGAKWNGEPCVATKLTVRIPEWREGDPPRAWWKESVGLDVEAVLVVYGEHRLLLFNSDGTAEFKVRNGGGPDLYSASLPVRAADRKSDEKEIVK